MPNKSLPPPSSYTLPSKQHWLAMFIMAACLFAANWLSPKTKWFEHLGSPNYETITPKNFGDWSLDPQASNTGVVDPQVQDKVASIYSEVVSRVYVHRPSGRRIMLSIAYGDKQTFSNQLHRPEACYSSQGFKILSLNEHDKSFIGEQINVAHMQVSLGNRSEYVSYFIRIGDRILKGPSLELNKARIHMAVNGYVADGLLFRVSEISSDSQSTYELQDSFIEQLLSAVDSKNRESFIPSQRAIL